jgi:hypothetical protein
MEGAFILAVVGLSSLAAALVARRGARRRLLSAAARALETVGLAAGFLVLNVALGFCLTLLARAVSGAFVSLYVNDDVAILILSALQALVFQWWREPEG